MEQKLQQMHEDIIILKEKAATDRAIILTILFAILGLAIRVMFFGG